MKLIFGLLFGIGCIFGGYVIAGGKMGPILLALPVKMMIIMGGALGAFVINNEPKVLKSALAGIGRAMKSSKYTKARYMELLALLYDILQKARKEGLMAIENDVENPQDSPLFQKYPAIAADHHTVEFITDYLRMMVSGNLNAHEIESIMDSEIEAHHNEGHVVVAAYARLAGALPAFGIVAAVMGVIQTMGSVTEPPEVLGAKIGAALLGAFLGIFLGYAIFEPLSGTLEQKLDEDTKELQCIKTALLASMQGYPPMTAIEFGRKVLYSAERPSFVELEGHVKQKK
ncbi:MAG: flagellar motor stator protein MotA [Comamonadaceae bacterium 32-67-11]|nr:MAG: flagellar motor stator protein MotA [Comamonadaceae bacterium 32-67-11]